MLDINGYDIELPPDFDEMTYPVRCGRCRSVYDVANVDVLQRYSDCSVWNAPCCGAQVDDRQWKSLPDVQFLEPDGRPRRD